MKDPTKKDRIKIYEVAGPLLAVALFAAGIYGVVSSRIASREYKNSDDIREVTAIVVYAKDTSNDDADYYKYWAKLSFVVDGKTYKGSKTFYRDLYAGDEVTVEVYRTSNGRYKLTPEGNPIYFLFYCIAIPIGGFLDRSGGRRALCVVYRRKAAGFRFVRAFAGKSEKSEAQKTACRAQHSASRSRTSR